MEYRRRLSILIILLLGFHVTWCAEYLSLPGSVSSNAVFYVRTKQLREFSCGYNVLFNAANFEHRVGFTNGAHRYSIFRNQVMPYLRRNGWHPKAQSRNVMTEYLAQNRLNLQPFYHLHFDKDNPNRIVPILTGKTRIRYPSGTSQREIERKMGRAIARRYDKVITSIQNYLDIKDGQQAVVHFLCYVKSARGIRHGVLLTLYQNSTGRGLYLFDNMNERVYQSSDVMYFIKYLIKIFNMSPKNTFKGPKLPYRWPHLDYPQKRKRSSS